MISSKFGFIGVGNMGGALARAVCKAVGATLVTVADKSAAVAEKKAAELGAQCGTVLDAAAADYIFLGVKPQVMPELLNELSDVLKKRNDRFVIVTMAAGVEISAIEKMLGFSCPIIRIMPNTPASVGKGMILYAVNSEVFSEEISEFCSAMSNAGRLDRIDEGLIDAASAVSGCGPAFVYLFIEALSDAGVKCGLPRSSALQYAAQTLFGSAALMLETGKHPAVLKDEVCSPAGSTVAGVAALENGAFRGNVINAVEAAYLRTRELGK